MSAAYQEASAEGGAAPQAQQKGRQGGRTDDMGPAGATTRIGLMIVFALFFGLPLLWLLLAPTKTDNQLLDLFPLAFGSIGRVGQAWDNLLTFQGGTVARWAGNSVAYTLAAVAISLAVSIPAGYALGTSRFSGRSFILWATLITMILPGSALVLPLFLEMNLVRLVNTPWAVILPSAFYPFGVYLAYIFYSVSLPKDLLAAGRVDGCSELQLFRHIGLPLARPLIGLIVFLSFTANWNNYFLPFVMLNKMKLYNLPVGLQALITGTSALRPTFATDLPIKRAEVALAGVVLVLPVILVFIFAQRFLVSGTLTGVLKE
jgi:multiple sugar transport system permease protein